MLMSLKGHIIIKRTVASDLERKKSFVNFLSAVSQWGGGDGGKYN